MNSSAVYLYCVVKASRPPLAGQALAGIPHGSAPEPIELSRSLWLIVSEVPLAVYGPDALEPKLRDLDWVAHVAVAHEAVVEHLASRHRGAVVPMKLFTMFSNRAKAIQDVGRRRRAIQAAMRRIEGCEEWGVRISRGPDAPASAATAATEMSSRIPKGTGAAFLAARKAARDASQHARRTAAAAAAGVFSNLSAVAKDARQRPPSNEAGTNPPILEAAFLVPARARARFSAEARRQGVACAAAGAQMTLSGPWPAYNFVAPRDERE